MARRAFLMRLKPGGLAEYKRHHDEIWPELVEEIKRCGITTMTIYEHDPILVMYSEIEDEDAWNRLWHSAIHDRWAEMMNPLMAFDADGMVESVPLQEIFHLE